MFAHPFNFDPSYGYALEQLLAIEPPIPPIDFAAFWRARFKAAMHVTPAPQLIPSPIKHAGWSVFDVSYTSTQSVLIQGWLVVPETGAITKGLVIGHGYGGREAPDFAWCYPETAVLFPCFRGLSRSQLTSVSQNPSEHVLYGIESRDQYILGGCVEDLWLAVSALINLYPAVKGHIGYAGISFGGGIGALALPWDKRIQRGHLNVPTFGHQALRLQLPTIGSGEAVSRYETQHGNVMHTLQYYDAASAAQFIKQPMHVAAALFDPAVAPPGQFAIYNALQGEKELFVLEAGHFDYPNQGLQDGKLAREVERFFEGV